MTIRKDPQEQEDPMINLKKLIIITCHDPNLQQCQPLFALLLPKLLTITKYMEGGYQKMVSSGLMTDFNFRFHTKSMV
jgi:hypothetical protein